MIKNIKEICSFGFAYSCVIVFCLFGPAMSIVAGKNVFTNTVLALLAFIAAFVNPFYYILTKKRMFAVNGVSFTLILFVDRIAALEGIAVFLFSFQIANLCRGFTLHAVERLNENSSDKVMSAAFLIAFSSLYMVNVLKPLLSVKAALFIIVALGSVAVYFYGMAISEEAMLKKHDFKIAEIPILPLASLYIVYIGGGISYAGIYPYLETFYCADRFYNVLPLLIFLPAAGFAGRKYGSLVNLFIGIILLSISFTFFMFKHTLANYFFIQTFLQAGWAFTNVFGFSYSWRLSVKYKNPYMFGYGIISILLGVMSGSAIAHFIFERRLPLASFGPFTFIPLVVSLIFQFFHEDVKKASGTGESAGREFASKANFEESEFCRFEVLEELTNREKEIIYYYYKSNTAVKIADKLKVSPNTVRTHIKNSYRKLGVSKREQLQELIDKSRESAQNE